MEGENFGNTDQPRVWRLGSWIGQLIHKWPLYTLFQRTFVSFAFLVSRSIERGPKFDFIPSAFTPVPSSPGVIRGRREAHRRRFGPVEQRPSLNAAWLQRVRAVSNGISLLRIRWSAYPPLCSSQSTRNLKATGERGPPDDNLNPAPGKFFDGRAASGEKFVF